MALEQLKELDLDSLYASLKKRDEEILKNYNDASISDNDYFLFGIQSDIISNSLDVLNNYYIDNIQSAGVDLSCRTIIEALVVVEMNKKNLISDLQKKIYRYSYALVDMDNFKNILSEPTSSYEIEILNKIIGDKKNAIEAILQHFNCKEEDLEEKKIYKGNPSFYLQNDLHKSVSFFNLLKDYPVFDECESIYSFFSILIHPNCELYSDFKNVLLNRRGEYIQIVLKSVLKYMQENNLMDNHSTLSFDQVFLKNRQIDINKANMSNFIFFMDLLEKKTCDLPIGYNLFTSQFLTKAKYLILDMMMSLSIGYVEHVVAIFKSFIEEFSVFAEINSFEIKKCNIVTKGYWLSTRLQFSSFFLDQKKFFDIEDKIKNIYDEYYKENYKKITFEKFRKNIKNNSLYFLNRTSKNYTSQVTNFLNIFFPNMNINKNIDFIYEISKDMCHATGYNFNASEGMVTVIAHKSLIYSLMIIEHFTVLSAISLDDYGVGFQEKPFVEYLDGLINVFNESLNKIKKIFQ